MGRTGKGCLSTGLLFPLRMQHLHEQGLRGRAAVAVLVVQVVLSAARQRVYLGQHAQQLSELVLRTQIKIKLIYILQHEKHFFLITTSLLDHYTPVFGDSM